MSDDAYRVPGGPRPTGGPGKDLQDGARIGVPWYGAPFGTAVRRFWRGYRVFRGRASRTEFWWWALADAVVRAVLVAVALAIAAPALARVGGNGDPDSVPNGIAIGVVVVLFVAGAWGLATLLPDIAVAIRRLHDTNRSGWWVLLAVVPVVQIVLIVFLAMPTDPRGERFTARTPVPTRPGS